MSSPSEASRVEAQLELTEADFRHALSSMPERRFGSAALTGIAGLVLVGAGVVNGFDVTILMSAGLTVLLFLGMNLYTTRLQARRFFAEIDPGRRSTAYVFTPTSLEITTKNSHVRQDYEALKRYVLTPHTLLLYSSSAIAQVIPLRAFAPGDRERVIGWVQSRVKPSPKVPTTLRQGVVLWVVLLVLFMTVWWLLDG